MCNCKVSFIIKNIKAVSSIYTIFAHQFLNSEIKTPGT